MTHAEWNHTDGNKKEVRAFAQLSAIIESEVTKISNGLVHREETVTDCEYHYRLFGTFLIHLAGVESASSRPPTSDFGSSYAEAPVQMDLSESLRNAAKALLDPSYRQNMRVRVGYTWAVADDAGTVRFAEYTIAASSISEHSKR